VKREPSNRVEQVADDAALPDPTIRSAPDGRGLLNTNARGDDDGDAAT
jgi:hypothetical protein